MRRLLSLLVVVWLVIGVLAAFQRGYFDNDSDYGCAEVGTIAVTAVAGPLNYTGLNPRIDRCRAPDVEVPQPSE